MSNRTTGKPLLKKATVHEKTVKKAHKQTVSVPRKTRGKDQRPRTTKVTSIVPIKLARDEALKLANGDKRRLKTVDETTIIVRNPIYKD